MTPAKKRGVPDASLFLCLYEIFRSANRPRRRICTQDAEFKRTVGENAVLWFLYWMQDSVRGQLEKMPSCGFCIGCRIPYGSSWRKCRSVASVLDAGFRTGAVGENAVLWLLYWMQDSVREAISGNTAVWSLHRRQYGHGERPGNRNGFRPGDARRIPAEGSVRRGRPESRGYRLQPSHRFRC